MQSRKEALDYGLTFPDTYVETPFRDTNWQLVRVKGSKKAFLWIYEKDGYVNLNVKADKEWRDYWRSAFKSVCRSFCVIGNSIRISYYIKNTVYSSYY
jgi:methylated-DNA-protein-cysteine methyltransferase related protein